MNLTKRCDIYFFLSRILIPEIKFQPIMSAINNTQYILRYMTDPVW